MVAGHGFTLIGPLVLLVNDNQSQVGKGGEESRAGADHNVHLSLHGPLPLIIPLSLGQSGIDNGDPAAEPPVKPHDRLVGQGNLRYEHNGLPPHGKNSRQHFHIHFRLAASCNSIEQPRFLPAL